MGGVEWNHEHNTYNSGTLLGVKKYSVHIINCGAHLLDVISNIIMFHISGVTVLRDKQLP